MSVDGGVEVWGPEVWGPEVWGPEAGGSGPGVPGLLAARTPDLAEHLAAHGPMRLVGVAGLVRCAEEAALTGRGGAGFPTARKLTDVHATGRAPVVVANGAEGEPWSAKDAELLARAPHLVLDGLELVASALRATETHLYAQAPGLDAVRAALRRRPGSTVHLTEASGTFVAGEESAVLRALAGSPALPFDRTERVGRTGLGGQPTLVQNVETLARLARLHRWGGTDDARLVTVSGDVGRPGVLEVDRATGLGELVAGRGGDPTSVRAVLVGGFHGAWVPGAELQGVTLQEASLSRFDAHPGSGVIHVLGPNRCGLAVAADIVGWLAGQSARQCGPCALGLPATARALTRLVRHPSPGLAAEVARLAGLADGRGSCRHPDGTARLVRSTLRTFDADVELHLRGRCEAA